MRRRDFFKHLSLIGVGLAATPHIVAESLVTPIVPIQIGDAIWRADPYDHNVDLFRYVLRDTVPLQNIWQGPVEYHQTLNLRTGERMLVEVPNEA